MWPWKLSHGGLFSFARPICSRLPGAERGLPEETRRARWSSLVFEDAGALGRPSTRSRGCAQRRGKSSATAWRPPVGSGHLDRRARTDEASTMAFTGGGRGTWRRAGRAFGHGGRAGKTQMTNHTSKQISPGEINEADFPAGRGVWFSARGRGTTPHEYATSPESLGSEESAVDAGTGVVALKIDGAPGGPAPSGLRFSSSIGPAVAPATPERPSTIPDCGLMPAAASSGERTPQTRARRRLGGSATAGLRFGFRALPHRAPGLIERNRACRRSPSALALNADEASRSRTGAWGAGGRHRLHRGATPPQLHENHRGPCAVAAARSLLRITIVSSHFR